MKIARLFFFLFLLQSLNAQGFTPSLPVQSTEIYKNSNIYQQDFLYLCEGLVEFHANVFKNFPEKEFNKEKETYYKDLAACNNEKEFGYIANKFTNRIRDLHTNVKIKGAIGNNYTYPFRCKYLVDTLVIMAVSDQLPFSLCGERIKSINGIDIKDIEKKSSEIYITENYVSLQNNIMQSINTTGYLKSTGIIHADTEGVKVSTYGGKEFEAFPNFNGEWKSQIPNNPSITERISEPFSYKIVKEDSLCYIQFNQMVDKRIGEMYLDLIPFWKRWFVKTIRFFGGSAGFSKENFEDFLNLCIEDIEKNNIKKVIVDLRWNTGGSASLGDILLYAFGVDKYKSYTSEIKESELYKLQMKTLGIEKVISDDKDTTDGFRYTKFAKGVENIKSRFHGDVYFITSEWTFSAAVQLATIVEDNHLFKVVGEPISERPSHFGEVLFLKLPNTKVICSISSKLFHRPDQSKDNDETLYPDVTIYKTYDSIKEGIDPVYNWIVRH
ncbi:MAG: S41 family peptidase [Bacteroidetes bacterium]|nr:S41 family peptidase [Bacteroidota bacterium]